MQYVETHSPSVPSYENHSRIAILSEAGFAVWPGSGTREDPYVIEGLQIINYEFSLYIANTSVYFIIRNCRFETSTVAARTVYLSNVSNGKIVNCTVKRGAFGIEIDASSNCTILNCTMYDSEIGFYVNEASNITIDGNRVYRNPMGIRIDNSTDCTIVRNIVYRNAIRGVFLNYYTHNCTIYNNHIGWNRGVSPESSEQNAFDDGGSNLWDDNISQGNYWSDWESYDPYLVNGIAEAYDRFPSPLVDNEIPKVDGPGALSYDVGSRNNSITWNCTDAFPCVYQIFWEDVRVIEETWDGQIIVFSVTNQQIGTHNYTLHLSDPVHTVIDSVIVRVYVDIFKDISPELLIGASIISVVFVVLVLMIVKQIK